MRIDELLPQTMDVDIKMIYAQDKDPITGKIVPTTTRDVGMICMIALSRHEWEEIGHGVLDAIPPNDLITGKPDYSAVGYRLELVEKEAERDARRLAQALSCEGGLEFKSRNLEGKAKELRRLDAGIYNALANQLWMTINMFQRKVTASADRFRSGNGSGAIPTAENAHHEPIAVES